MKEEISKRNRQTKKGDENKTEEERRERKHRGNNIKKNKNAFYFRRGLTCTLGLTNDLIDGGQPRTKNGF